VSFMAYALQRIFNVRAPTLATRPPFTGEEYRIWVMIGQ